MNSSGVYDINSYNSISNDTTILSTFNVSGLTQLNTTTINSSLKVSGSTILNKTTFNNSLYDSGFTKLNNDTTINSSLLKKELLLKFKPPLYIAFKPLSGLKTFNYVIHLNFTNMELLYILLLFKNND